MGGKKQTRGRERKNVIFDTLETEDKVGTAVQVGKCTVELHAVGVRCVCVCVCVCVFACVTVCGHVSVCARERDSESKSARERERI